MKSSKIINLPKRISKYLTKKYRQITCTEILVIGDSHAGIFHHNNIQSFFSDYFFNIVAVDGATVSGLKNPNSKTQAMPKFFDRIRKSRSKTIIISLGEVDTGFVIWYRAEKNNIQVTKTLSDALRNYQNFLLNLSRKYRILCISTPLPTIKDGQDWGEIANARKHVKATQLQRTKLTIEFNKKMKNFCRINAIEYLDFDEESIGDNELVIEKLIHQDPTDHHYNPNVYSKMIIRKLKEHIA